ncbi:MAG: glycosyltransferase family 4 protein [Nitrososphaeraceae archaeon]|nr:glycosyltransferase family 4 protein [Nitrososphaeraceae archaeon]
MKILVINSAGHLAGGAENHIVKIQSHLEKKGHIVKILASNVDLEKEHFNDYSFKAIKSYSMLKTVYYLFNPFSFLKLKEALKLYKPDIIHLHTMQMVTPSVLFLLKEYPTVMTLHGPEYFLEHLLIWLIAPSKFKRNNLDKNNLTLKGKAEYYYFNYLQKFLFKIGLKNVDIFIAPSRYIQKIAEDDVSPIMHIPNFIDPMSYYEISNNRRLLFVGRLEKIKGVHYLIKAMSYIIAKYSDTQLTIIGDGPEKQNLLELSKTLHLENSVHFLGWVEHTQLEAYYKKTTLVIVPSICPENFPTVCNEAMSVGRPVIGTNVGGIPEIIDHGLNGYVVEPKQVEEIAERVIALFEDEYLLKQMSLNARSKTKKLSIESYTNDLLKVYEQILNQYQKKLKIIEDSIH